MYQDYLLQLHKTLLITEKKMAQLNTIKEISKIKRLGAKTFEQCIGFLRIVDGEEPLDNTAIHPESYKVTYEVLEQLGLGAKDIGTTHLKSTLTNVNVKELATQLNVGNQH